MAMKFRAHETFFIRKGWLNKGMERISNKPNLFVDKKENPMDILGIGSNMVKSLRYWLQAVGLTKEPITGKRNQTLTKELGEEVYKSDRYIEELGTLYLLQYKLAANKENATAWYFFFNKFTMSEFSRDDFVQDLQKYILITDTKEKVAIRSLNDDFNCIVSTYLPRYKSKPESVSPENNIDCPFGELGLIDYSNQNKIYKKITPAPRSFNPWVILAVIIDQSKGRTEIGLNELLTKECNIGRVFNLDAIAMIDVLHEVENIRQLKIVRTAGLDIINLINPDITFTDCVRNYYKSLNEESQETVNE
jgi:hypothetical protein